MATVNINVNGEGELNDVIDQRLEAVVHGIESELFQELFVLEQRLKGLISDEAWEIYQQMDMLVAEEKGRIQRACYAVGVSHVITQLMIGPGLATGGRLASETGHGTTAVS